MAAPEQYGFGQSDARTDVYAVGMLMKQLFVDNARLVKLAGRATKLDPKERFQSIKELQTAIMGINSDKRERFPIPPGFRTKTPWKMAIAVFGYAFFVYVCFTLEFESAKHPLDKWLNRFTVLLILLGWLDLFAGWSSIFAHFPLMRSEKIVPRVLGYIITALAIPIFWIALLVIVEAVLLH